MGKKNETDVSYTNEIQKLKIKINYVYPSSRSLHRLHGSILSRIILTNQTRNDCSLPNAKP